jgi:hypothetical protein
LLLAEPVADRVQLRLNPVSGGEAPIGGKKQNCGSEDPNHRRDPVPKTSTPPADAPASHQVKNAQHDSVLGCVMDIVAGWHRYLRIRVLPTLHINPAIQQTMCRLWREN